jgi:hypothetical protein
VRAGKPVSGAQDTAGDDGGVVCPETAAPFPRSRCGGPLYLLICIKPLDAFTSGAERLQSELVQTFPCLVSLSVAVHFGLRIEGLVDGWAPRWACYFGWGAALSMASTALNWEEEA